jgi:asparagine synthase (glutamine-hydrolysing)
MCGIAGILGADRFDSKSAILDQMTSSLRHRGPDGNGTWTDEKRIWLGHSRLSIVDLTSGGAQPMISSCGNLVITFNGEIYNHRELALSLKAAGVELRSSSDTEVLLELIAFSGLESALQLLRGMFAFALWDCRSSTLTLARDRFGEKPLFYGRLGQDFGFASELKTFRAHPDFRFKVDNGALASFLKFDYVPTPQCII